MKNDAAKVTTSYKEVRIGNTIYRVTSVFTGEKDLGKSLEQLAIRRAGLCASPLAFSLLRLAASLHDALISCIIAASEKSGESQSPQMYEN